MWIKITPKDTQNQTAEPLHLNTDDISTVAFGDGIAQIRLSSAKVLDIEAPEEIALLKRFVEGESLSTYQTFAERLPEIIRRSANEAIIEAIKQDIAEDNALRILKA